MQLHPDRQFVKNLLSGLEQGFDTGISATHLESYEAKNLLSSLRNKNVVSTLLQDEISKGYVIGPFHSPPFETYRISPIGIAEHKYSGKKRLIVDLSAPHNNPIHPSLNELINKDDFSLSYVKLDDAISIIKNTGKGSWLCKTDIKDAFKQIPIKPSLWNFHGIKWNGLYYFFTRLVFGSRSSPKIFDNLSKAVIWIAEHNYGIQHILHLLDDFLTVEHPSQEPDRNMALLTHIFNSLKIPLSQAKTVGPTTNLEYLGIELDTCAMLARLPPDKQQRISQKLGDFLGRRTCTKQEILSLLGHLVFASRVIKPGRTFMSRLFHAAYKVRELYHRVTLTKTCKADLHMWEYLLKHWNGISLFVDDEPVSADSLHLYTDASGTIGFGGYYQGQWFASPWSKVSLPVLEKRISIAFQELFPIVVSALLWGQNWKRKHILFHCDNEATVHIINKGRSPCPDIMKLMRRLVITATINSFNFSASHVPGHKNVIADALSRLNFQKFRSLAPQAAADPSNIPSTVMFG